MSMKGKTLLKGHALLFEGRAKYCDKGVARCQCGEHSPALFSDGARKRWHREHKAAIRELLKGEK